MPPVLKRAPKAEVTASPALSLMSRPGETGIRTRRVALLIADGVDGEAALQIHATLLQQGAVPRFIGVKMGQVQSETGDALEVEVSLEAAPSVLWDACIFVNGDGSINSLAQSGHALEFLKDQYRHCKPVLLLGTAPSLLEVTGIPPALPDGSADRGLLQFEGDERQAALTAFIEALTNHRVFERETDPPIV